jgi:flagellar basal-body rod protein FlgB
MSGFLDSVTNTVGNKSLDALWLRASVISDNIANADTPGYVAKSVSFEDQLNSALAGNTLSKTQLDGITPKIIENSGTYSAEGSGVDIETQLIELIRNQLQYSYLGTALSGNLGLLKIAATEGKG